MKDIKLVKLVGDIKSANIDEIRKLEVGVEIQSFPQNILDGDYSYIIKECKFKLRNFDNIISLHGSSFDLNPGSTDKKVLELTKYRYMQSINIAKEIGAKYVIFHSQISTLISVDKIRKLKINNQILFWKEFLKEIDDLDITILLENEYEDSYDELLYIIKEVNSPKLKICLDTGHVLAYSNKSLESWFLGLNDYIKYVHLHFNEGKNDSHTKPTNDQLVKFKHIIEKANIKPIISLEYNIEDAKEEISRIREILDK